MTNHISLNHCVLLGIQSAHCLTDPLISTYRYSWIKSVRQHNPLDPISLGITSNNPIDIKQHYHSIPCGPNRSLVNPRADIGRGISILIQPGMGVRVVNAIGPIVIFWSRVIRFVRCYSEFRDSEYRSSEFRGLHAEFRMEYSELRNSEYCHSDSVVRNSGGIPTRRVYRESKQSEQWMINWNAILWLLRCYFGHM